MNDEIKLPPLPDNGAMLAYGADTLRNYARLAVEQDRARREKQEPHEAVILLGQDGIATFIVIDSAPQVTLHKVTIRWTSERAWIESERNRALAQRLRNHYYDSELALDVADALDGGEQ